GYLGVYQSLDEGYFAVLSQEPGLSFSGSDGVGLIGTKDLALPPVEALEVYGGDEMRQLVQDSSDSDPIRTYEQRCPLHYADEEGIYAMLGGWHVPWPENDAYDDEPGRLVLWTFRDAEPWLEVWQRPSGKLDVIPRIT